jgi:phage tail sheath gpL-like
MPISFNSVPSNLRVPFVAVEIDNSRAAQGAALLEYRALFVGQKTSGGSASANTLHRVTSADQVRTLAGAGSMLHRQALAWFANNKLTETWILVLADDGAAVAATGTFAITGPATAAGTFSAWVGGERIAVAVASGDSATVIGEALEQAINADTSLPVTANNVTGTVTCTAKNAGSIGNQIDLRTNYADGEAYPAGVGCTVTAMASGATDPTLTSGISALTDQWFHVIAHPYSDDTSLDALEAELASRFGPMRMIDGVMVTSKAGAQSALSTLGDSRNSPHSVIVSQPGENPVTSPFEFAAAVAGLMALHGANDPARPFQTLAISRVKPPADADLFTFTERNTLLGDGIATSRVGAGGVVQIERLVTTYQTSPAGSPDPSYKDANTMLTLMYLRYSFRVQIANRYPRHKLANDGTRFGAGQAIITPMIGKGEALAWFRDMEALGLVEGFDQFKADLVVERNESDANRLDFKLSPDLINQLIVTGVQVSFLL